MTKRKSINKIYVYMIIAIFFCMLLVYALSWLPKEEINFSKEIALNNHLADDNDFEPNTLETITITGKIYQPLFSDGHFVGNISFDKSSEWSREITISTSTVQTGDIHYDTADGYIYDHALKSYMIAYCKKNLTDKNMTDDITINAMFNSNYDDLFVEIKDKGRFLYSQTSIPKSLNNIDFRE